MGVIYPLDLPTPLVLASGTGQSRGLVSMMDSGRTRHRRGYLDASITMNLSWNFTADQFDQFVSFYQTNLRHGARVMSINIRKFNAVSRKNVRFLDPENISISGSDNLVRVTAQVLVDPVDPVEGECDFTAEETFETYGVTEFAQGGFYDGGCGCAANWMIVAYPPAIIAI